MRIELSPISHMVLNMGSFNGVPPKHISREDYEKFCQEYIFDILREKDFGAMVCDRFDIQDVFLRSMVKKELIESYMVAVGYLD